MSTATGSRTRAFRAASDTSAAHLDRVDHQDDAAGALLAHPPGHRLQRRAVDARVGDEHVVDAVEREVQRLGGREGEHAAEDRPARPPTRGWSSARFTRVAQRSDFDATRTVEPTGLAEQVRGVGVERVQVDEREGRDPVAERRLVARQQVAHRTPSVRARWSFTKTPSGSSRDRTAAKRYHPG